MANATDYVSHLLEDESSARFGVTVGCLDLTRQLAETLAASIPDYQRTIRAAWVAKLARMIDDGFWSLSPDALSLVLDDDLNVVALENGQHRVLARLEAKSNKPCPVLVMARSEHDHDTYLITDMGHKRSLADWLKIQDVPNVTQASSVIYTLATYDRLPIGYVAHGGVSAKRLTTAEAAEWWKACDKDLLEQSIDVYRRAQKLLGAAAGRYIAMVYYMASRDWPEADVDSFVEMASFGRMGYNDDGYAPAGQVLHDRIIKWKLKVSSGTSGAPAPAHVIAKAVLKAWQDHTTGNELKILRVPARFDGLEIVPDWVRS